MIFALYGSWEAGDSLKIVSRGVGTFSTIEELILRTSFFRLFFGPSEPDPQSATRLAQGRSHFFKIGPICIQISARSSEKSTEACLSEKSATRLAQGRSHFSNATSKKERDPPCTSQKAAKARNIRISHGARQVAPTHSHIPFKIIPGAIGSEFGIEFH